MPTYEFRCPSGHDFEEFYRSIASAPSEVHCPTCGKVATRQMSAGGGLVFKGSGFYITDYGKDGKKSQTPPVKIGDTPSEKPAGDVAATKPESSPAADGSSTTGSTKAASESKPAGEAKPATPPPAKKSKTSE